jgi:DNA excision repair protein ERCC-4
MTPRVILRDTREQREPPLPDGCVYQTHMLREGDYSTPLLVDVARIERKSVGDFVSTLSWGRERFDRELERLHPYRWKCIVVEGDIGSVLRLGMHRNAIIGSIASMLARHDVATLFALDPAGVGRLMAGLFRRWEERLAAEREAA